MGKYFGTDGIRGIAGTELSPTLAFRTGLATAEVLAKESTSKKVYIGKDTRKSGDMLEAALIAGLTAGGLDVWTLGVVPTPAVAYLTATTDACAGIVISASHNPGEYNGIKIFATNGYKLPDAVEEEIEAHIDGKPQAVRTGKEIGSVHAMPEGAEHYIEHLKSTVSTGLTGVTIALDCGHGANSDIAPRVFEELGAKVVVTNREPDGMNINANCGSTNPSIITTLVKKSGAACGFSFDGDGDRVIAVDETGEVMDGDHMLAALGLKLKEKGALKHSGLTGTVMTNIGLDRFCDEHGLVLHKAAVGDRYVLEDMRTSEFSLGGEQSGHIIFLDHNTTGDGLLTALKLVELIMEDGVLLSEKNKLMFSYPQVLVNARVHTEHKNAYKTDPAIQEEIKRLEESYHGVGRVLIRPSGTEPLVRVMIEGEDIQRLEQDARALAAMIEERYPE